MSRYYWIGNVSSDVGSATNWSLYPLTGVTLPPAAASAPTGGDEIYFQWPDASSLAKPIYGPEGTVTGGILFAVVEPDFELDIGSETYPLGVSANNIIISKKYQSTPEKGSSVPSVYLHSSGPNTYLQTSLWGDASVPQAFTGGSAPQVVMNLSGQFRTVAFGDSVLTDGTPGVQRSETLIFGKEVETTIGGTDLAGEDVFIMSQNNASTIVFGPEATVFTPENYNGYSNLGVVEFKGSPITVKLQRGADFSSNCGGISIVGSGNQFAPSRLLFERSSYSGATGYDDVTRTSIGDLRMNSIIPNKQDPLVQIDHGVDILGTLELIGGKFVVGECQEVTRTYGAASKAFYWVGPSFSQSARMELAPNCSIRNMKIYNYIGNGVPDIIYDAKPLKTLFLNQNIIEGYTGL